MLYISHSLCNTTHTNTTSTMLHGSGSGGWVTASAISLTGDCYNIPIVNATVGSATGCFLRPNGTFANVRNGPSTNNTQVTTIYPNQSYSVLGTDASTDWIFFNQGWVARTVLELSGACTNLPILNPQFVGSGTVFFCPQFYRICFLK